MPTIFLSDRRSDTDYETTAIAGRLAAHFGREHVFMDVDAIPAGQDFRRVIRQSLDRCDVAIIVIGKAWLAAAEESGTRRLENPADYLRLEVETALGKGIPVIPLLVGGATMPKADDLPDSLAELAYRHAVSVRPGRDFERDLETLIDDIVRTSGFRPASGHVEGRPSATGRCRRPLRTYARRPPRRCRCRHRPAKRVLQTLTRVGCCRSTSSRRPPCCSSRVSRFRSPSSAFDNDRCYRQ